MPCSSVNLQIALDRKGGGGGRKEYVVLLTEVTYIQMRFRLKRHTFGNGDFRKRFQKGRHLKTPYFENGSFFVWTGEIEDF